MNGIANCCYGNAYQWETNPLVDDLDEVKTLGREIGNPDDITLRAKSVAVFGIGGAYTLGHVVFIEEVSGGNVIYSHCNGVSLNNQLGISNGEIEVPNSIAPFKIAQDGRRLSLKEDEFRHKFGNGLRAIIYKL